MAAEVHTRIIVDVQALRTSTTYTEHLVLKYRINVVCGNITSLFLLVVRSIACSTYLCREVDVTAGQLACHHKYQGMLP